MLWSLGCLWVAHKSKNKLTAALFLKINEKKHTVFTAQHHASSLFIKESFELWIDTLKFI